MKYIYVKEFNENPKNRYANTWKWYNRNINKFILLLQKRDYPYQLMDISEKSNETSIPEKEKFYSHLNMEDTTDAYYTCKNMSVKILKQKFS